MILVLGGLGLPVPEEAPIILAAILSRGGSMWWPLALASCLSGVLLGDFIVYFLGFFYGEKVLSLPLTRKFLTRPREEQIKGYFHRHGVKILILGRFAVGFRTAAYLTAGILKLPTLKLFVTDLFAASLSTFLMFGLGYAFAHQIQTSFDRVKLWLMGGAALTLASWLLYRYYKARRRGRPRGRPQGARVGRRPAPPRRPARPPRRRRTRPAAPPRSNLPRSNRLGRIARSRRRGARRARAARAGFLRAEGEGPSIGRLAQDRRDRVAPTSGSSAAIGSSGPR